MVEEGERLAKARGEVRVCIVGLSKSTREGNNVDIVLEDTTAQDVTAEGILERLSDLENHPRETLAPYETFACGGEIYYFTPGGFLYRRDPGTDEVGGYFCGYLTDEVWHYRTTTARQNRRAVA
jgi:hypothetical protein